MHRAARLALRVRAELDVVHVRSEDGRRQQNPRAVGKLRDLAGDLGAHWFDVEGDDPVQAIARFARQHQITQIVIGASNRSRWQQFASGGSNVTRLLKEAGPLGVSTYTSSRGARRQTAARRPMPPASLVSRRSTAAQRAEPPVASRMRSESRSMSSSVLPALPNSC